MPDFTNEVEAAGVFTSFELDEDVDFVEVGDQTTIVIRSGGFGEGGFGEGPFGGGEQTVIVSNPMTVWTNIETP